MINEIIEQIGGRERLLQIIYLCGDHNPEVSTLARIALSVLDAKPVAYRFRKVGTTKWKYSDVENYFQEVSGTEEDQPLHTTPPAASVPDGWKLVPIEPSWAMINAAIISHEGESFLPFTLYKAMLAAAPAPGGK